VGTVTLVSRRKEGVFGVKRQISTVWAIPILVALSVSATLPHQSTTALDIAFHPTLGKI
jgi:paraquat-inducible protein B